MQVFHFAAECYPLAKVGGLADVVGALPKYQQKAGIAASVVVPYYQRPFVREYVFERIYQGRLQQGSHDYTYEIWKEANDILGFALFLIKIPGLLDREEIYCYPDEDEQFLAFQHAALDWLCSAHIRPDIIHCHDHHTGLIPFYIEHAPKFVFLKGTPTVGTIHNGQYQGWMPWPMASLMPAFDEWKWGLLDWNGIINRLGALVKCSWVYTTVSAGYLDELFQQANGLESLLAHERGKAHGIINGIDQDIWDSSLDEWIAERFSANNRTEGKRKNKKKLLKGSLLDDKLPLLVFIGRFALEKGADLIPEIIELALHRLEGQVNFFVLGSGNPKIESNLYAIKDRFPQHLDMHIGYNERLAHQLYASADFLLMPSRVEPCGLNQLYAMRYGAFPIVRATGGLKDTVKDIDVENGYGILFQEANAEEAVEAIERSLMLWKSAAKKSRIGKKIMELDFSWDKSASQYIELYKKLID